ncbi:hypothetical protein KAU45_06310 [bacterium]|nr:hypothetical protein [bacterium]
MKSLTLSLEELTVRRWIVLLLVILGLIAPGCQHEEIEESGAEANYLNDCRPYDLLLEELLGTLSSERVEELLARTDDLGMTVPVDEELLGEIEGVVEELRLFNFTAPTESLADLGAKREIAYEAAIGAADILFEVKGAYTGLVADHEAGEVDIDGRQAQVRALLDTYRTAREELKLVEGLLPELLESVGERP